MTVFKNASKSSKPAAVIYTHSLLEGSNTFIKSHAEALRGYRAIYAGARRVPGLDLPKERAFVVNEGTPLGVLREAAFRRWGWAPTLVRRLSLYAPRVVHAHFGTSGPAGMALARRLGVPLVVTFHGFDATMSVEEARKMHRGRELLASKDRLILETGTFIAVSTYIKQRLLEQGYPEDKIRLHRNGIDLDFFKPRQDTQREPVIVFVGRFMEKKGAQYLIDAAHKLHVAGVGFQLVLIGNGPLDAELREAARRLGIPCTFTGFLPTEQVKEWLQRASVVAVPSVTAANGDSEGLPTIVLEAQAMETPIVASRHSGIPEGVHEGVTAELVEERDSTGLAAKLRLFLEDSGRVSTFGRAGRAFVHSRFDLQSQVLGLEAIYAELSARQEAGHLRKSAGPGVTLKN